MCATSNQLVLFIAATRLALFNSLYSILVLLATFCERARQSSGSIRNETTRHDTLFRRLVDLFRARANYSIYSDNSNLFIAFIVLCIIIGQWLTLAGQVGQTHKGQQQKQRPRMLATLKLGGTIFGALDQPISSRIYALCIVVTYIA